MTAILNTHFYNIQKTKKWLILQHSESMIIIKKSTSEIILTDVEGDFECDTRIDELLDKIKKDFDEDNDFTSEKQVENDIQFRFRKFIRKN